MAEEKTSQSSGDIEKELSVGNFAAVQARTLGFQLAGIVLGAAAGFGLAKTGLKNKVGKWANDLGIKMGLKAPLKLTPEEETKAIERAGATAITFISTAVGSVLGGIASMYEHWVKVERERLGVQEINKDVASIMEKRVQFEETIDKQHGIVKDLLAKQEALAGKSMSEKVRSRQETSVSAERS